MDAPSIIADLPLGPGDRLTALLQFRVFARYLADHVREAQLEDGSYLGEVGQFERWMRELADAARSRCEEIPELAAGKAEMQRRAGLRL